MIETLSLPPLALYVHFPWCVKKCPYCDFNSHVIHQDPSKKTELPEEQYFQQLQRDLEGELTFVKERKLSSIFFGGGTPSLMSANLVADIISMAREKIGFVDNMEITLEANPGAAEQQRFKGYQIAGVNRVSLGVQSFDDQQLKKLGRIHDADEAQKAVDMLRHAGMENFNLDLMFALQGQTVEQALTDLQKAIELNPSHLSWYQLTIEPNTVFYREKPVLPDDDLQFEIMSAGHALLKEHGYQQYETSAFSKQNKQCAHNRNYWEFGDYLGIGAGAHGKVTILTGEGLKIRRRQKTRVPEHYLQSMNPCSGEEVIHPAELPCEFAMNALRLVAGVPVCLFEERTGLPWQMMEDRVQVLIKQGLLSNDPGWFRPTKRGALMLNHVLEAFLI